jgi:hypothetical protein
MQVNFKFAPTFVTMRRKPIDQSPVILFRGKEVSMNKGAALLVSPRLDRARVFRTPPFHPPILLGKGSMRPAVFRDNRGFKMIGENEDQMHNSSGTRAGKPLPGIMR